MAPARVGATSYGDSKFAWTVAAGWSASRLTGVARPIFAAYLETSRSAMGPSSSSRVPRPVSTPPSRALSRVLRVPPQGQGSLLSRICTASTSRRPDAPAMSSTSSVCGGISDHGGRGRLWQYGPAMRARGGRWSALTAAGA